MTLGCSLVELWMDGSAKMCVYYVLVNGNLNPRARDIKTRAQHRLDAIVCSALAMLRCLPIKLRYYQLSQSSIVSFLSQGAQPDAATDASPQYPVCEQSFGRPQERDRHVQTHLPLWLFCRFLGCPSLDRETRRFRRSS
jgi:hypothetical protein